MKIKWYGQAAFRIIGDDGYTIMTDSLHAGSSGLPTDP